jgi:glycosyltransferase involved in cell wall biosynthesis
VNILLINYEYPPIGGGAANATRHIAKEMRELGCKVSVVTSGFRKVSGRADEEGISVYRVPALRSYRDKSNLWEMASYVFSAGAALPFLLKKEQPDGLLVFFSLPCGPLGVLGKWLKNTPYVVSLRGGDVPGTEQRLDPFYKILQPFRRYILKNSLAVVANSEGLKQLSELHDPFKVGVISNGVDTGFFLPRPHCNEIFRFLFVGRYQRQKNLFFLLKHLQRLADQTDIPFQLDMVGDGPLKRQLQEYSSTLPVGSSIIWHGWCPQEQLRMHYQSADCLLNPSLYEGMPNVLLEAMACGLPVIASDVAGNREVVRHGETGFLFSLSCPEDFIGAMQTVLSDRAMLEKLGESARRETARKYSWKKTAAEYLKIFTGHPSDKSHCCS